MASVTRQKEELKELVVGLDVLIMGKALEWARETYKRVMEKIDELLVQGRESGLSVEHIRPVWYTTCLGPVRLKRRQYREQGGAHRYLLDEISGVEGTGHATVRVRELAMELASDMSFRRTERTLEKTTGVHLCHQTIWKMVGETADPHLEREQREIEWLLKTGEAPHGEGKKVSRLIVEADGAVLPLQRERERNAEVKLGIAYEGWTSVSKGRYATVNKTMYSDVAGSQEFWAGLSLKLQRKYDLGGVRHMAVGGDGAGWTREGAEYLGGTFQLCRYHLNRELTAALGRDRKTKSRVMNCCSQGDVDGACRILWEAAQKTKGEQAEKIRKARRYLVQNSLGIPDYRLALGEEGGKLRRTGAIEGNVDKLIVRRMKNQGMSWSRQGIRRMLYVRFLYLEGKIKDVLKSGERSGPSMLPIKKIHRVIDSQMARPHIGILETAMPALYGPHASRPWVAILKSMGQAQ